MNEQFRVKEYGTMKVKAVDVTFEANDFMAEHPELSSFVRDILFNQEADDLRKDLEIKDFADVSDSYMKVDWEKARYVVENIACLWAAEHLVGWGEGYRSDDGFDYLNAALDNARFLTNIDLTEEEFRAWWDASPYGYTDEVWGATDGEIRFMLFPHRAEEYLGG